MQTYHLTGGRLTARIMPFGATLIDLRLAGWDKPLILGFDELESYARANHYAGAIVGRHANRIFEGRVRLDGEEIRLPLNSQGHHLHGGEDGLTRQFWDVLHADERRLEFSHVSPDGHQGYPGRCHFTVIYEALAPATLRVTATAQTDRTTIVNLCHHPYFNFTQAVDIFDHVLEVAADAYLGSGPDLVPDGEVRLVKGTHFDFRSPRRIGLMRVYPGFNHNYCLATSTRSEPHFAARLSVPSGPTMELWTTQTGLHVYDGYKLQTERNGLDGAVYGPNSGVCLEAQNWPNSPHHRHFPSAILRPEEHYRQVTEYRFA